MVGRKYRGGRRMQPNIAVGFVTWGILVATRKAVSVKKFVEEVNKMVDMRGRVEGDHIIVEGQDKNYVRGKVPVADLKKPITGTALGIYACYELEEFKRHSKVF
jgi:hypothetical protein